MLYVLLYYLHSVCSACYVYPACSVCFVYCVLCTVCTLCALCAPADPMVAVSLDGSPLHKLLADTSEFEKLCTSMFESLDTDRSGQLSMSELKPALQELGLALGIPPAGGMHFFTPQCALTQ